MLTFPHLKQLLLLVLISTQALTYYIPREERVENTAISHFHRRDGKSPDATPYEYLSDLNNCGPVCKSGTIKRRWLPYDDTDDLSLNATEADEKPDGLGKRAFTTDMTNVRKPRIAERIDSYVANNLPDPADPQFTDGSMNGFYVPNSMNTVAHQSRLMDENGASLSGAFQFGTGSLHGCTMLTIVSNRAVWMAHFWEGLAWNKADTWTTVDQENLQDYVIGALLGNGKNMDNVDPIDWSLFNDDCDETRVFWMTPAYMNSETSPANYALYKEKIKKVQAVIDEHLESPETETFLYQRLMYNYNGGSPTGTNSRNIDTGAYGQTMFQWDGREYWRLFYEHNLYSNDESQNYNPGNPRPVDLRTSKATWRG